MSDELLYQAIAATGDRDRPCDAGRERCETVRFAVHPAESDWGCRTSADAWAKTHTHQRAEGES